MWPHMLKNYRCQYVELIKIPSLKVNWNRSLRSLPCSRSHPLLSETSIWMMLHVCCYNRTTCTTGAQTSRHYWSASFSSVWNNRWKTPVRDAAPMCASRGWNAFPHLSEKLPGRKCRWSLSRLCCVLSSCFSAAEEEQQQSKKALKKQQKEAEKAVKKAEKQAKLVSVCQETLPRPSGGPFIVQLLWSQIMHVPEHSASRRYYHNILNSQNEHCASFACLCLI